MPTYFKLALPNQLFKLITLITNSIYISCHKIYCMIEFKKNL